ncbi:hypothetical protein RRG08_053981 [Elysia crispata]|uniref:Uncharacterized protein n=1 Tax=Elysia crispata TaxID=231223 RepID=A0AAE1CQB7_9GAST|nr:hypothetical protein RRG08_053981 [Elysia crispata]
MGKFGCGSINNNGERLVGFCASNDLVIGGTLFNHPAILETAWYSPNGRDKNQIDHIAINGISRGSCLLDVQSEERADVVCGKFKKYHSNSSNQKQGSPITDIRNCTGKRDGLSTSMKVLNRPAAETEPDIQEGRRGP